MGSHSEAQDLRLLALLLPTACVRFRHAATFHWLRSCPHGDGRGLHQRLRRHQLRSRGRGLAVTLRRDFAFRCHGSVSCRLRGEDLPGRLHEFMKLLHNVDTCFPCRESGLNQLPIQLGECRRLLGSDPNFGSKLVTDLEQPSVALAELGIGSPQGVPKRVLTVSHSLQFGPLSNGGVLAVFLLGRAPEPPVLVPELEPLSPGPCTRGGFFFAGGGPPRNSVQASCPRSKTVP